MALTTREQNEIRTYAGAASDSVARDENYSDPDDFHYLTEDSLSAAGIDANTYDNLQRNRSRNHADWETAKTICTEELARNGRVPTSRG